MSPNGVHVFDETRPTNHARDQSAFNRRRLLQGAAAAGVGVAAWSAPDISSFGFTPAYAAVSSGCLTSTVTFNYGRAGSTTTISCVTNCGSVILTGSPGNAITLTMPEPDQPAFGTFTLAHTRTAGTASFVIGGIGAGNSCTVFGTYSFGGASNSSSASGNGNSFSLTGIGNNTTGSLVILIRCGPAC